MEPQGRIIKGIKYYNKDELAEILGVHYKTIEKYLRAGKIKGIKLKTWLVSEESLQAYLKGE